jgi:organic radical activating enzyme
MKFGPLKAVRNNHPDVFQVTWIINDICSNSCSYCLPSLFAGTNHGYDWNNAKRFVKHILDTKEKSHWSISGGEPTMSPFFKEFVKMVDDAGSTVGMTTNGVKPTYYLVDIAPYLAYIAFSYHPQFSDDDALIEKILSCAFFTASSVRIMLPANQPYWDKSMKFIKRVHKMKSITYETVRVLPFSDHSGPIDPETHDYTEDQLKFFDNPMSKSSIMNPNRLLNSKYVPINATFYQKDEQTTTHYENNAVEYINRGYGNLKGWSCSAGIESVFVGANGRVTTANCHNDGIIGHIDRPDEIKWPKENTICKLDLCHCATDFILSKRSPEKII